MMRWIGLWLGVFAIPLHAQTYYQPLEYEFHTGGTLYFYGGDRPAVHEAAAELHVPGAAWGRQSGFAFSAASVNAGQEVETERIRVFSDQWRGGLQDAGLDGFTIADARNEAYASVPRYFRKSDIVAQATEVDGWRIVSPRAGSIVVRKSSGQRVPPTIARPLMIIPREQIDASPKANIWVAVD